MKILSSTLFFLTLLITGCSNINHSVQSTLYERTTPSEDSEKKYKFIGFSGNPIFVDSNSIFEIKISEIMPGWIHQGVSQQMPFEKHNLPQECKKKSEKKHDCKHYTSWKDEIADQLYGKELWIVSKIESINKNDVLERNSKVYYNATNVKLNSLSFAPIPLDIDELKLFSHASDSAYRLSIKVYEVKGFDFKREALKAYDNNPGISGLIVSGWEVLKNTFGSLAGDIIENQWKNKSKDDLFIERLLLANDAVIEFQGMISILRDSSVFDNVSYKKGEYILYDPYKSNNFNSTFDDKSTYETALNSLSKEIDLNQKNINRTYLKLTIEQSVPKIDKIDKSNGNYTKVKEFLDNIQVD